MKQAIKTIQGQAVPLLMDDIDTDIIIPAQHLTQTTKSGYGQHAFARLKQADPDLTLNQARFQTANTLITAPNFVYGPSR